MLKPPAADGLPGHEAGRCRWERSGGTVRREIEAELDEGQGPSREMRKAVDARQRELSGRESRGPQTSFCANRTHRLLFLDTRIKQHLLLLLLLLMLNREFRDQMFPSTSVWSPKSQATKTTTKSSKSFPNPRGTLQNGLLGRTNSKIYIYIYIKCTIYLINTDVQLICLMNKLICYPSTKQWMDRWPELCCRHQSETD